MLEEEQARLGRDLDEFEREQKLREIIDMKIERVVLALGVGRSSVHFVENYKCDGINESSSKEEQILWGEDQENQLTIEYRALRLLHECTQQSESYLMSNLSEKDSKTSCSVL